MSESSHPANGPRVIDKPDELLALHDTAEQLFETLRRWFGVPDIVEVDLAAVDSAVRELGDPQMIAALAMRKLQALHLLATPGVRTTTDVVVAITQDLERALLQVAAATTDWDAELVALEAGDEPEAPVEATDRDAEVELFRALHSRIREAVVAVLRASEGEICILV